MESKSIWGIYGIYEINGIFPKPCVYKRYLVFSVDCAHRVCQRILQINSDTEKFLPSVRIGHREIRRTPLIPEIPLIL